MLPLIDDEPGGQALEISVTVSGTVSDPAAAQEKAAEFTRWLHDALERQDPVAGLRLQASNAYTGELPEQQEGEQ